MTYVCMYVLIVSQLTMTVFINAQEVVNCLTVQFYKCLSCLERAVHIQILVIMSMYASCVCIKLILVIMTHYHVYAVIRTVVAIPTRGQSLC